MQPINLHSCTCPHCVGGKLNKHRELHQAVNLLLSQLPQPQRRLFAAIEAVRRGPRGAGIVSNITGISSRVIARGIDELGRLLNCLPTEMPKGRPGRRPTEMKYPDIELVLEQLLANETAGDPMTKKRWVRISSRNISKQLETLGYTISYHTVCRLLRRMGYSLKVNVKKRASIPHYPKRDIQFDYITEQKRSYLALGNPMISVDCKKKELIGNFRANGKAWCKDAIEVDEHSFASMASCVATPYGVYDVIANKGFMWVGTSKDTPAFAVTAIENWWLLAGREAYSGKNDLLILADSGGSNGFRCRAWRLQLQLQLCDKHGLTVTVCHYPSGCSKYNPIERQLFSQVSVNWAGKPLDSIELMLGYIRGTTTQRGLAVQAFRMSTSFPLGQRVSKKEMEQLALQPHIINPEWNYTIRPRLSKGGIELPAQKVLTVAADTEPEEFRGR